MLLDMIIKLDSLGLTNENDASRAQALRWINYTAKRIWNSCTLPGADEEAIIGLDTTNPQMSLPWFIYQPMGIKFGDYNYAITRYGRRMAYQPLGWGNFQRPDAWLILNRQPLFKTLTLDGPLTVTFATALTVACRVTIVGKTTTAAMDTETLDFLIGDTTKTSTKHFRPENAGGIKQIIKSVRTNADCAIYQTGGIQVGEIPNNALTASNLIVQLRDASSFFGGYTFTGYVNMWYKTPYQELYADHDTFIESKWEDALIPIIMADFKRLNGKGSPTPEAQQEIRELYAQGSRYLADLVRETYGEASMSIIQAPNAAERFFYNQARSFG